MQRSAVDDILSRPPWAKLIDFETTLPAAIEGPVRQQQARAGKA
jgi:hypothetical protein